MIGIVTVLYKSANVLPGFFQSLSQQSCKDFTLYAVENKSPDTSLQLVRDLAASAPFKTVVIEAGDNVGAAKGNNLGIERALADGCDLILMSNNDVEFGPDAISGLCKALEESGCQIAVPKFFNFYTGKLWYAGGGFGYKHPTYHCGNKQCDAPKYNVAKRVEYAPTTFMLIKREVFEKAGLLDENYFAYYEDTDFVWRATKQHPFSIWYDPKVVVMHKVSNSSGSRPSPFAFSLNTRNSAYFMNKYFPWYRRWAVNAYQFTYYFLYTIKHPDFPNILHKIKDYRNGLAMYARWKAANQ